MRQVRWDGSPPRAGEISIVLQFRPGWHGNMASWNWRLNSAHNSALCIKDAEVSKARLLISGSHVEDHYISSSIASLCDFHIIRRRLRVELQTIIFATISVKRQYDNLPCFTSLLTWCQARNTGIPLLPFCLVEKL